MIVSCPNCSTNFNVPEAALGRMVKCARCGHIWKTDAPDRPAPPPRPAPAFEPEPEPEYDPFAESLPMSGDEIPGMSAPSSMHSSFDDEIPLESPGDNPHRKTPEMEFGEASGASDLAMAEIDQLGFTGEGNDPFEGQDDPFANISELMTARKPESMPDMYSPAKPKRPRPKRKGAFILWVVLLILFLAAAALGLYFFQDKLIDHWPGMAKYYEHMGARRDEVGAGLSFRNYNSERLVQDNNEVLIVRGVIANGSETRHEIPLLRLALYNGTALLQEKIISPPQATLDAHGTVGFKVTLEQPDANATRFEVTFIAAKS